MTSPEGISIDTAFELCKKLKLRFLEGHFNLRKWRTNKQKLCEQINETESILEKVLKFLKYDLFGTKRKTFLFLTLQN